AERLRQLFAWFQTPAALEARPLPLLVPGGGTGRQPLSLARAFPETEVLSVDLSRASLGYAKQRAARLGIGNVAFLQGDILDLGQLGRRFPAIACTGVLHHLADPLAGWRVLSELLEPGGAMQIALYSRLARQDIVLARDRIAALGLGDGPEDIRAFRRRILEGEEPELAQLAQEKDFADLHGCRDLLFHRQEHRFDLAQIAAALDDLGLEFLGFDLAGPEIARAYAQANPQDPRMTDLTAWQAFEEANPMIFRTMYNFWCRKPAEDG
ncbi:MAG: class I SAM-dependent methyltransferase, partial [Rhodovibrionaceae bacterium]